MSDDDYFKTRRAIYDNVAEGKMEIAREADGETHFRLTEEGKERARAIFDSFIDDYGKDAATELAASMTIPEHVATDLIAIRLREREDRAT